MKRTTLTTRVMAVIKGGDESKLVKFEGKIEKYFERQRREIKEAIESYRDKMSDAQDVLKELVEHPDVEKLKTEGGASYVPIYLNAIQDQLEVVEGFEYLIEECDEQLARLDKIEATIYPDTK